MNAVTTWESQNQYLVQRGIDECTWNALLTTIYPGAKPDSVVMAIDYCRARKLDIMLKPVHLVPMQVKDAQTGNKEWRDVPMPGIGLYRIQADRSGNYAGADEPEFGPVVEQEYTDTYNNTFTVRYPEWCKYTVYKVVNGERVAYKATEYWLENYATQSSKTDAPNAMWKKRPYAQLAKCAEAQALRKGWPEIGSDPTAEEMEGKSFIVEERDVTPKANLQTLESKINGNEIDHSETIKILIESINSCGGIDALNQCGDDIAAASKDIPKDQMAPVRKAYMERKHQIEQSSE